MASSNADDNISQSSPENSEGNQVENGEEEAVSTAHKKRVASPSREVGGHKRFKIASEADTYKWSMPEDLFSYANDNFETFILEKSLQEGILVETPRPENVCKEKKLDSYFEAGNWVL